MNTAKKTYVSPKLFEVELNPTQAILTTCNNTSTTLSTNSTRRRCVGTCRRSGAGGQDNTTVS